jgi:hypothetical protein
LVVVVAYSRHDKAIDLGGEGIGIIAGLEIQNLTTVGALLRADHRHTDAGPGAPKTGADDF